MLGAAVGGAAMLGFAGRSISAERAAKPNILILMTDNQYAPHLGCYGDKVVKTPNIDKMAKKGVRFTNTFCSAPSCAPSRAGYLTGQDIWRLEEGANLHGILPKKFPIYTDLLSDSGYFVGYEGKGWGPGNVPDSGREQNPAGTKYKSFEEFLKLPILEKVVKAKDISHEELDKYETLEKEIISSIQEFGSKVSSEAKEAA